MEDVFSLPVYIWNVMKVDEQGQALWKHPRKFYTFEHLTQDNVHSLPGKKGLYRVLELVEVLE